MFNVVLILLGQHCTGKNFGVWITALFGDFYFEPVNFFIITGCCKSSASIAQIFPTLNKKIPRPTLNKKTRLYGTVSSKHHCFVFHGEIQKWKICKCKWVSSLGLTDWLAVLYIIECLLWFDMHLVHDCFMSNIGSLHS